MYIEVEIIEDELADQIGASGVSDLYECLAQSDKQTFREYTGLGEATQYDELTADSQKIVDALIDYLAMLEKKSGNHTI